MSSFTWSEINLLESINEKFNHISTHSCLLFSWEMKIWRYIIAYLLYESDVRHIGIPSCLVVENFLMSNIQSVNY